MSQKKSAAKIDYQAQLKRALADYQNLQKRLAAEKNDFIKFSNASLLDKLLPILDDLQRAQKHLKNEGIQMIINQFETLLKSENVQSIKAKGQKFDPQLMDCVELTKGKKNQVVEVIKKGYTLNQKVLRPAQVKVGKGGK